MSDSIRLRTVEDRPVPQTRSKSSLLSVIRGFVEACKVDTREPVLVVGGGQEDLEILTACGFSQIVMSNLDTAIFALDAENIALPDDRYPVVFAHAVLHHCRSPQRALGEMVRVSQKHVFFLEPNDSWAVRLLVRLGYSFPYELAAVADNEYVRVGLRNGPIPNYIYRWTRRDVEKSVRAYQPERAFDVHAYPYWDFYVNENDLLLRKESRVSSLAQWMGPRNLLSLLRLAQTVLNRLNLTRSPGNKFFCSISKRELQPWIGTRDGEYCLKRNF